MVKGRYIKKVVRKAHLWLGLTSGLVLTIVGLTGSLYVFEPEIISYLERELYQTKGQQSIFTDDIEMSLYVEEMAKKKIESIQWPRRGRETYTFKFFGDDHWYYLDQTTGKLTGDGTGLGKEVFEFIFRLHTSLTMGNTGRIITGVTSLLFALVMLTTGLYLWWPRTKTRRKIGFRIQWNAKPKILNYSLHNVNGFYFFLPLFFIGITGGSFYFRDEVRWVLNKITFSIPAKQSEVLEDRSNYHLDDFMTVQQVLGEMDKYYEDYERRNLWMTKETESSFSLAYQKRTDIYPGPDTTIFLDIDPISGKILSEYHPDKLPTGDAIIAKWLLQVHFGEFGGLPTRILWCIAGLMPALLTFTGAKIWLGRMYKRKRIPPKKR